MKREISIAFQTDKTPARYIALAKQVDQYDFDVVSVYCDAPYHPSYGPLLLMSPYITRARVGPAAVSPARIPPIDIAAETALLAGVAGGGVYVGIARGAWLADHAMKEHQPPLQAIREAAEIVRYLLEGGRGGYQGQVFQLAPHVRAPYPLPSGRIPLMIGSWGAKLCAIAGELADEVKVGGSANPDIVPVIQSYVTVGELQAKRAAGTVGLVMGAVTVVDEDRVRARQAARRAVALYLPVVAPLDTTLEIDTALLVRVQAHVNNGELDDAAKLISDDLLERFAFAGNVDDLVRQAESLFAAGTRRVEFGTPHGLDPEHGIDLIGKYVIPALRT